MEARTDRAAREPMRLHTLPTYLSQFGLCTGMRFYLADLLRAALDPYAQVTYAQGGEDSILRSLLGPRPGFYVEVGANHPQHASNVFHLYRRGWRGISIEPNKRLAAAHRRLRRRDTMVAAVVSDAETEVIFTEFDEPLVSSVDPTFVSMMQAKFGKQVTGTRRMTARSLTSILDERGAPPSFELLSIDVEGHDFQVLSSLDLERYRPGVIVIEMHGFDLLKAGDDATVRHLRGHGFDLVGHVATNSYFRDTRRAAA